MNVFHESFQLAAAAAASGVPPATIKTWLHRDLVIRADTIVGGGGPGQRRVFTFHSVIELAIAKALLDAAATDAASALAKSIFAAAAHFGHTGRRPVAGLPGRIPGVPFRLQEGLTILAVNAEAHTLVPWRPGVDSEAEIRMGLGGRGGRVQIDANDVFNGAVQSLGHDPTSVMMLAYEAA